MLAPVIVVQQITYVLVDDIEDRCQQQDHSRSEQNAVSQGYSHGDQKTGLNRLLENHGG